MRGGKSIILLLFTLLCMLPCLATDLYTITPVVVVKVGETEYRVTELLEHKHPFRQPEYWRYKLLNSDYTLTIHRGEFLANKELLKSVPDRRDYYTKHPNIQKIMMVASVANFVMNILQIVGI